MIVIVIVIAKAIVIVIIIVIVIVIAQKKPLSSFLIGSRSLSIRVQKHEADASRHIKKTD